MQNKQLKEIARRLQQFADNDLPRIVKSEGLRFFEQSFERQGWQGTSFKPWKPRKTPKGKKAQKRNKGRAILVGHRSQTQGGHLKDSLQAEVRQNEIIFSSDKEYAAVHNYGLRAGRGKGFKMPQRQFMGPSPALDKKIEKKITRSLENIFKS